MGNKFLMHGPESASFGTPDRHMSPPVHMWLPYWRLLLLACPLPPVAFAADGVWNNAGGGSWSASTNWAAASTAGGVSSVADFSGIDLISRTTVTLSGPRTAGARRSGQGPPRHECSLPNDTS